MEISAGSGPTSSMSRNTCPRRIWFWSVETLVESGTVIHGMMQDWTGWIVCPLHHGLRAREP